MEISLKKLDMMSHHLCILGQLFGTFGEGLMWLAKIDKNHDIDEGEALGFTTWRAPWDAPELTRLWKAAIRERKAA